MTRRIILLLALLAGAISTWAGGFQVQQDSCGVARKFISDQKTVYLVFTGHFSIDDAGYFENFDGVETVLDILRDKGVKGSFFPTAITLAMPRYEQSIRRIINEGHYLSGHSYGHLLLCDTKGKTLVTRDSVNLDLKLMEYQLNRFGLEKKDYYKMIPPYETTNRETARWYQDKGYSLLIPTPGILTDQDWTQPGKPNYMSAQDILDCIWKREKESGLDGVILLIHAMNYPWRTPQDRPYNYLGEIIDRLRAQGYSFGCIKDIDP